MRKFTFNQNQTVAQTEFIAAASANPRKPYFTMTYRNDLLRFANPEIDSLLSVDSIPFSYQPYSATQVLVAGYDSSYKLRVGTTVYSKAGATIASETSVATENTGLVSGYGATLRGSWSKHSGSWLYYFMNYNYVSQNVPILYSVNTSGGEKIPIATSGLPNTTSSSGESVFTNVVRPAVFLYMEHGDKIVVYTSYKQISAINQLVCTMSFYHAAPNTQNYRKLRTTIQYDIPYIDGTRSAGIIQTFDPSAARVFGMSTEAGKFFIVANDGTKAIRFTYNLGVEGMAEPIIPIDLDANRLEITDSDGKKTYGKYHKFMPCALTKINELYYLNGQMIRTYSNGDSNVMEVYLFSEDGINWSVGDVSFFIDSTYYKKDESQRLYNYSLLLPDGGSTMYAMGNNCFTSAPAREIDTGNSETDFTEIVINGGILSNSNSADSAQIIAMKGFGDIDPSVLAGKTVSIEAGYYSEDNKKGLKIGEYFVESEAHEFSNIGKGPNKIDAMDLGVWKLTRWSSVTDIDRWSSAYMHDDLKALSKIIVKGISSGYKAVDNATGTGLYLDNLNDPFVGYTSTKDDRDGMFTVCARFKDTGTNKRLTSIGLLIGAEDYTDIYTKGKADRKGFNAYMIPCASNWTGHVRTKPEMRVSNLKRRVDDTSTPENESDSDRAFQWIRRYTSLWERDVYTTGTDSSYNKITTAAATDSNNVIYEGTFSAQYDTDYEFVVRKHSGRAQLYYRKKGFTSSTISSSEYTDYTLIHEYQFGKDNRIDWGPRPYWGFVANTDVFASLEGWNSREYGDIETTLTDASENITNFQDFPDSELASFGERSYTPGTGSYSTTSVTEPTGTYYDPNTNQPITTYATTFTTTLIPGNAPLVYLVEKKRVDVNGTPKDLSVGEIVRCFVFIDLGGALTNKTGNYGTWGQNIDRDPDTGNIISKSEFYGIIAAIEDLGTVGKKIWFAKTWGGFISTDSDAMYYAIYKVKEKDYFAQASSGSISVNLLTETSVDPSIVPVDIKTGSIKQSEITAGRAAFVNRQNDAISIRFVESDGTNHYLHSGSWNGTKLGFDYPTNPISSPDSVGSSGYYTSTGKAIVTTRDWRLLMHQGRLFPFSASTFGLPDGVSDKRYMIKGDEIIRYRDETFYKLGRKTLKTWCVIPTYYTPIFPSQKDSTTVQQWSVNNGSFWIQPGDQFSSIANSSGLRLFIVGKESRYTISGEKKYYAVSTTGVNTAGDVASTLTFTPKLDFGAISVDSSTERAKESSKQVKEIAILSGRGQFDTETGLQSYTDPLCYYPVGPNTTKIPEYLIKVHYWNMNVGLYNSAMDNLKYVCNLSGIRDVQFMDKTGTVSNNTTTQITSAGADLANFVLDAKATVTTSSYFSIVFRSAYRLRVDVDVDSGSRALLTLKLETIPGFVPANQISTNSYCTLAKVSVPVSDILINGQHDFRIVVRKERVIVEMDRSPVWTFDMKCYKIGDYDLLTNQAGPITISTSNITGGIQYTNVELSEEVENQIVDMSQSGGEAVQFVTRERHIHARSTQNGGIQFGRFLEGNRSYPLYQLPTSDYIRDSLENNPYQVPGHVLVTGAEYGEHIDASWIRSNGYRFSTNQNRLLDTVEDSIKEAKLLIRMTKEESDSSEIEMTGMVHMQPEDGILKIYSLPEAVANEDKDQIISAHVIEFDQAQLRSKLQIRKKYSMG